MACEHLTKKKDIELIMKRGKNIRNDYCGIKFLRTDKAVCRVGFIIGVKVDKRAVLRNRLRRQYRNIVDTLLINSKNPIDILFFPSKKALNLSHEEQKEYLRKILQTSNIIS